MKVFVELLYTMSALFSAPVYHVNRLKKTKLYFLSPSFRWCFENLSIPSCT